jgi:drug/metabolite transporter (DMT)-like permease
LITKDYSVAFLATVAMAMEAIVVELFYVLLHIPTVVVATIAVPSAGAIILLVGRKNNLQFLRKQWKSILFISTLFATTEFLWYDSVSYIGATKVTLVEISLETMLVVFLAILFLHERLGRRKAIGAIIVLAGVIISVNVSTVRSSSSNNEFGIGDIEIILAAVSGAVSIIAVTRLLEKEDTFQVTGFALLLSGFMLQLQWLFIKPESFEWSWWLLLTPLMPLSVFLLQFASYKKIGAALTSIIVSTHLILVIILQSAFYYSGVPMALPENLTLAIIGGIISIGGIIVLEKEIK